MGQACKATRSSGDMYRRDDVDAIISSGAEGTQRPLERARDAEVRVRIHVHMTQVIQ